MFRRLYALLRKALGRTGARHLLVGRKGERIAARHLRRQGLRILARNVREGRGEIDLVAAEGDTLVFVEVKTRTGGGREGLTGLERVDARKRAALRRACALYLRKLGGGVERYRLDVITVELHGRPGGSDVRWYRAVEDLDAF